MTNDNMDIWNRNCKTDSKYVKDVPKGGFKLTSIDAQYQLRMATQEFGAMGRGFGIKGERFEIHGNILFYQATFWWKYAPEGMGEFAMFSDIKVEAGRDVAKKVQTDALTKALSRLGFNADVFLNEFDGNKYSQNPPTPRREPQTPQAVIDKGVDFQTVTSNPPVSNSPGELPHKITAKSRESAIKIINAGRKAQDEQAFYSEYFTITSGKWEGRCFVNSEADFIKDIQKSIDNGWDTDKKLYAISIKACPEEVGTDFAPDMEGREPFSETEKIPF